MSHTFRKLGLALAAAALCSLSALAQEPDQVTTLEDGNGGTQFSAIAPNYHSIGQAHARQGIPNIDSLVNWNDHYFTLGFDSNNNAQNEWFTNTVGAPPNTHGTTYINAPIVPVSVQLLNFDGTPRKINGKNAYLDATQYVNNLVNSPIFSNYTYSSSPVPTQFTDAVQRAEYYANAKSDWHTILVPSVKTPRVISLLRGTYRFGTFRNGDLAYVLVDANTFVNALFPATDTDTTTPIGAAENAGEVTTKDMSTFLFPNTFLYVGNPRNCCILGFHTYDVEPATDKNINEKRYVVNYSSWILPGLFGPGFQDVTATSHEIAESFNDPFVASDGVHNITPWWTAPQGNCQNNLEDGDVVEGLGAASTYPITMNGYTYHPQNEALTQFFTRTVPSNAIDGAYTYPNENINGLTSPSPVMHAGCTP